jgi:hypothetical protein
MKIIKNDFNTVFTLKNFLLVVLFVLLLVIATGGLFGSKYHNSIIEELAEERKSLNDSLIMDSEMKQQTLNDTIAESKKTIKIYKLKSIRIEIENSRLYETIRRNKKLIDKRNDTSFINNANVITGSVDRYYKAKDSIK